MKYSTILESKPERGNINYRWSTSLHRTRREADRMFNTLVREMRSGHWPKALAVYLYLNDKDGQALVDGVPLRTYKRGE